MRIIKLSFSKTERSLSVYEQNVLLPILVKGLEMKKGKANAATGKQIVHGLRSYGLKITDRELSRVINYIRINDLINGLMASNVGYYISNSEEELMDYENSLLIRETSLKKLRKSIEKQRQKMFAPTQKHLF